MVRTPRVVCERWSMHAVGHRCSIAALARFVRQARDGGAAADDGADAREGAARRAMRRVVGSLTRGPLEVCEHYLRVSCAEPLGSTMRAQSSRLCDYEPVHPCAHAPVHLSCTQGAPVRPCTLAP